MHGHQSGNYNIGNQGMSKRTCHDSINDFAFELECAVLLIERKNTIGSCWSGSLVFCRFLLISREPIGDTEINRGSNGYEEHFPTNEQFVWAKTAEIMERLKYHEPTAVPIGIALYLTWIIPARKKYRSAEYITSNHATYGRLLF